LYVKALVIVDNLSGIWEDVTYEVLRTIKRRQMAKRILIAAIVAILMFVALVLVGNTPDPSNDRPARVQIGTATCVVRTVNDVEPCPTN
jgi:hypothetical protein